MALRVSLISYFCHPSSRGPNCAVMYGLLGPHFFKLGEVDRFQAPNTSNFNRPIFKRVQHTKNCTSLKVVLLLKMLSVLDHIQSTHCCKPQAVQRMRLCSNLLLICLIKCSFSFFLPFFSVSFPCSDGAVTLWVSSLFGAFFRANLPAVLLFIRQ